MTPIQNLNAYLRKASAKEEEQTIKMLQELKSAPSILGDEVLVEEPFPVDQLTEAQKQLFAQPFFTEYSDAFDHLCTYSEEECRLLETTGLALSSMNAADIRDETRVRAVCPSNVVEYRKIGNAAWDPRKRDTVIQLKFQLSSAAPMRLVKVPFCTVSPHLAMVVRHVGKPFQGAHMTITDPEVVRKVVDEYMEPCFYFIATFWVGPVDKFKIEIGTAYRSAHFPGVQTSAPDHVCRILIRGGIRGEELKKALADFEDAYGAAEEEVDCRRVPVLLQRKDFIGI